MVPFDLPAPGRTGDPAPLRGNWSARGSFRARRLLAAEQGNQLDALFFHTQVAAHLSTGLMRRIPTIISLDATPINFDTVGAAYRHKRGTAVVEALKHVMHIRLFHTARALVTWSDWARQSLIHEYGVDPERITVIPPGVNLALWPRPAPKPDGHRLQVLFVGEDFVRKGGETLLRAYKAGFGRQCELHLVTKAPIASAPGIQVYRDLSPNSELLKRLYADADLFVLPTQADCSPLALQEAMAAGVPVVSTRVGAIHEIVLEGKTGMLVPSANVEALRAAISRLLEDATLRHAMGRKGQVVAEQRFDSAANARRIVRLLEAIALNPGHGSVIGQDPTRGSD